MLAGDLIAPSGRGFSFRRNLKCYPPAFLALEKPDLAETLERSDKVVLYSSYVSELEDVLSSGAPLIFEVVNNATGKRTHVGVLEFSGENPGIAYVPAWVMFNLQVNEGGEAVFRARTLPKLRSLRLKPVGNEYIEAFGEDPKGILEESLRTYTAVTEGDELVVHHADVAYGFKVLEIKPENISKAADLVGAECEVVFEASDTSAEGTVDDELKGGGAGAVAAGGPRALLAGESNTDDLREHNATKFFTLLFKHDEQAVKLTLQSEPLPKGESPVLTAAVKKDVIPPSPLLGPSAAAASMEYSSRIRSSSVTTKLEAMGGGGGPGGLPPPDVTHCEADLYISALVSKPGRRCSQWKETSVSNKKELTIQPHDEHFPKANDQGTRAFYIAVTAYGGGVRFTLTADAVPPEAPVAPATSTQTAGADPAASDVKLKKCDNCDAMVPEGTYVMHAAFCRRNNVKCADCGAVIRTADRDKGRHSHCTEPSCKAVLTSPEERAKHVDLVHNPYPCDLCGIPVLHELHEDHVMHVCEYRKVECVYCSLNVPYKDRVEHEAKCGGRTVPCDLCGRLIARKHLNRHKAVSHQLGDPSRFPPETPLLGSSTPITASAAATTTSDVLGGGMAALGLDDFSLDGEAGGAARRSSAVGVSALSDAFPCPACNARLDSLEECQVHLVTACSKRGSDEHRELVRNLVGEDAVGQIAPAEAAPAPQTTHSSLSRVLPEAAGPRREVHRPTRRAWECPVCKQHFSGEDECQIHVLTGCGGEAEDPSDLLSSIRMIDVEAPAPAAASPKPEAEPAHHTLTPGNAFSALADADGDGKSESSSDSDVIMEDDEDMEDAPSMPQAAAAAVRVPAVAPAAAGAAESFRCPSCNHSSATMEDLQIHMLTECEHAAEHAATMFS